VAHACLSHLLRMLLMACVGYGWVPLVMLLSAACPRYRVLVQALLLTLIQMRADAALMLTMSNRNAAAARPANFRRLRLRLPSLVCSISFLLAAAAAVVLSVFSRLSALQCPEDPQGLRSTGYINKTLLESYASLALIFKNACVK
jgi:hypothetical protein